MGKRIGDFKVLKNSRLNQDHFILELLSPDSIEDIMPGQFAEIRIDKSKETFLRRPFSFHNVDFRHNKVEFLIQIAGKGTHVLSQIAPGEYLNIIYPLGNSFTMPEKGEKVILVGGGSGVAPLLFLSQKLYFNGVTPDIILGYRTRERIIEYTKFLEFGKVYVATEDGSEGFKGLVSNHPLIVDGKYDRIYCCGPEPMMKKIALIAKSKNTFCEVSLENLMACGMGICLCCAVNTIKGNLLTCTDGPVFNINDLAW